MKWARLILAIHLVLLLGASSQCTFESDDDDDDNDKPTTQQPQPPQPPQPQVPQ